MFLHCLSVVKLILTFVLKQADLLVVARVEPDEKTSFLDRQLPEPLVGSSPSHLIPWTEESFQAERTYMQMLSSPLQGEPPIFHFFCCNSSEI